MTNTSLLQRLKKDFLGKDAEAGPAGAGEPSGKIARQHYQFEQFPEFKELEMMNWYFEKQGYEPIFFASHSDISDATLTIGDRELLNFSSYNYLGLAGDPRVIEAAKRAVDQYGASTSAARIVSGEIDLHGTFESELAAALGVEDCVVSVSGYGTNAFTIGYLCRRNDLILYDELAHNSMLNGCSMTSARRLAFAHNDYAELERLLEENRGRHERVLILVEGVYSMDGDIADIPRLVDIKNRHKALLMVDEAHSFGVIGEHGFGVTEHFGLPGSEIDILFGSLSKAFASCGGYIAGSKALVAMLKFYAPGIVLYGASPTPANTAAALEALRIMRAEPDRIARLRDNAAYFIERAKSENFDVSVSEGSAIVPIMLRDSELALWLAVQLFREGICVYPMMYPVVPRDQVRLRFFISALHSREEIDHAIDRLAANFENAPASKGYFG